MTVTYLQCRHGVDRMGRHRTAWGCPPCTRARIRTQKSRALALRGSEAKGSEVRGPDSGTQEVSILRHLYNRVMLFLYSLRRAI